jgi:isoquinoline 1-oxidoreductase subunit beta
MNKTANNKTAAAAHAVPESQATFVFPSEARPLDFISLNEDNTVTVISKHMEMGQGIYTLMATLIAEELDAAPEQMRVLPAPFSLSVYANPLMGGIQGTGGQTSTQASYMTMRMAGAAMRQMIIGAAAARWQSDPSEVVIAQGVVSDASGTRRLTFAELAKDAMAMPVPQSVTVKSADRFIYAGKHFDRVDIADKVRGKTVFTQDFKLPGMLTAVIARPTRPGAKVASYDATETLSFPGVTNVVTVPNGVAVVAENFWAAYEARERLKITWDNSQAFRMSSADISDSFKALLNAPGLPVVQTGDADAALEGASRRVIAEYEVPYQAHATMETANMVMQIGPDGVELWGTNQIPMLDFGGLSHVTGIPLEKFKLNMFMAGGSFGRRSHPRAVPAFELLSIIQALQTDKPVKLMYSREDDMGSTSTPYRPAFVHRIEAGLDAGGNVVAWKHRAVGQSVLIGTAMAEGLVKDGVDPFSIEGSNDQPYEIPNVLLDVHQPDLPICASWMRSSGSFHNTFANESMVDELAAAAGVDPLEMRRNLIPEGKRERACLEMAAEKAGWSRPLQEVPGVRRGRGIATAPAHRSFGAAVVEVSVSPDNNYTVDRIVCALDCGTVINPDNVRSQIEGSSGFGLSMARYSKITFKDGEAEQHFYSDHHIVRMHTMPKIEAHIVPSNEGPSGSSETISALIAPALANALANATGERVRSVPLRLSAEPPEEHWDVPADINTFAGAKGWNPPKDWKPIGLRHA